MTRTLTIRINAARCDVTVQDGNTAPTTITFNRDKEAHRQEVADMMKRQLGM